MSALTINSQSPNPGEIVTMFILDTTRIGGSIQHFCQAAINNAGITFGGIYYTPVDVEFSGFDLTGTGAMPQPKIKVANTNSIFQALVNTYGDLVGCTLQRLRTFAQFLDGAALADPTACYGPDTFRVERKVNENQIYIEWELSSNIDNEGKLLPGRVVIRDTCLWRYRRWNAATSAFDYTKAQCPYTGSNFYDINGATVATGDLDVCSRHLSGCKLRFGSNQPLPFGGFPGVSRAPQ